MTISRNDHRRRSTLITAGAIALSLVSAGSARAGEVSSEGPSPRAVLQSRSIVTALAKTSIPTAVSTASQCTFGGYAPTKVVLGATTVSTAFSVKVSGCTLGYWVVLVQPYLDQTDTIDAGLAYPSDPVIDFSPKFLTNDDAGTSEKSGRVKAVAAAWAQGEDPAASDPAGVEDLRFAFLRQATWGSTVNATPEPVKKGKKITLTGTLKRIDWNASNATGRAVYGAYSGPAVRVQFKAAGTSAYTTVKTVNTGSKGKVSTTVTANRTGHWRLGFAGNSTTGAVNSPGDAVKVN